MAPITGITSIPNLAAVPGLPAAQPSADFKSVFEHAVSQVEGLRNQADLQVQRFLSGEGDDLHEVALATQRAELSLELFQQVRNKVVSAYQEIMRMQM